MEKGIYAEHLERRKWRQEQHRTRRKRSGIERSTGPKRSHYGVERAGRLSVGAGRARLRLREAIGSA